MWACVVALAQSAEHWIVAPEVTGSTPVGHPTIPPKIDQNVVAPVLGAGASPGSRREFTHRPRTAAAHEWHDRQVTTLDFGRFEALTFDCYGTLIDWETGILAGLRQVLDRHGVREPDDELLERYAAAEAALEAGPYRPYREVLAGGLERVAASYRVTPGPDEVARFGGSVADWPAFPDSPAALARLAGRFRLGILTNCDDDLFAASNARLGVTFEWIVTAEQARGYKPRQANFELLLERLAVPPERILHVAQSLYHDHVPAKALGLTTVWIDRRRGRTGFGATPPAEARPDATFQDMTGFAAAATPDWRRPFVELPSG